MVCRCWAPTLFQAFYKKRKWKLLSRVPLFATPWAVHGFLQARIMEWVAFPFSRGSSQPRNWTRVSCIAGKFFINWAMSEAFLNHLIYFCLINIKTYSLSIIVLTLSRLALCDPMDCSMPGFPVLHYLPKFVQTHAHWVDDAIYLSHPLLPLSHFAFSLSRITVFSNESALCIR